MGRASEAGYSLEPETNNLPSEHGGSNDDMRRPTYVNTEIQLRQSYTQSMQSPNPLNHHNPPSSSHSSSRQIWKRFAIPTKTDSLSSGFPFHPHLYTLKVTHDQWHLFTSAVVAAAKMTATEDYLAWTTGLTAGAFTLPFLIFFAPVAGYYSGKAVHKKTLVKTVKEKMREEGGLREVLKKWNDETFSHMGFQAWLEVPRVKGELDGEIGASTVDIEAEVQSERKMDDKKRIKIEKKAAQRFRIVVVPIAEAQARGVEGMVYANGSVVGTESESGSVLGANERSMSNERGMGVSEMAAGSSSNSQYRGTLPPAYWDANAVEAFNDVGGNAQAQAGLEQYQGQPQQQQVIHNEEGVSPILRDQPTPAEIRGAPLEREIRYTRLGGYTNT